MFREDLATNPDAVARVEPTPEFLRPVMGYAAYLPSGPFDAWQQGYFGSPRRPTRPACATTPTP